MKLSCLLLAVVCLSAAAEDITPHVGPIEIYGVHKVSLKKIQSAAGIRTGDVLPSREDVEERLDRVPGVVASRVEASCCDKRDMILYIGVEEKDAPHFPFHGAPTGDVTVPVELAGSYQTFLDEVANSLRARNADEDLTNGYSLMADPVCRQFQQSFIPFVEKDLPLLDKVIRESADPEQRTMAAYLLQYAPRGPRTSKVMVDALQYALQDQEDRVRQTAIRSLEAVMVGARVHPEQKIAIEPTWFVELMNSVVWSDRHYASVALVDLTESRNPETLALIRERALSSVLEMARWHDLKHALPGFILAGRLAGLSDNDIQQGWISGDREPVLKEAMNPKKIRLAKKNG